jgi:hypothetical protein
MMQLAVLKLPNKDGEMVKNNRVTLARVKNYHHFSLGGDGVSWAHSVFKSR